MNKLTVNHWRVLVADNGWAVVDPHGRRKYSGSLGACLLWRAHHANWPLTGSTQPPSPSRIGYNEGVSETVRKEN